MKRLYLSPLVLLSGIFFVMLIVSCEKKGDTGPAGPAGPAGASGDSASGTVVYSDWLDLTYKPDTVITQGKIDTIGFYADINVPALTVTMLNTADIKVYINTSDSTDPVIDPLPYYSSSGLYIQVSDYKGGIELYSNAQVSTFLSNGKEIQQYRYMIVPGNSEGKMNNSVNWADYAAVKVYLGLKD